MTTLEIGEESPMKNEHYFAQLIADRFKQVLSKYYNGKVTKRMFHPKMHGLVAADFIIEKDLPAELREGIFSDPKTYPAWIRLSNAKRKPSPDRKKDMRGMAIKLFEVPGQKLLKENSEAVTHDFLLVTAETLQTKSVRDFQKSIYALLGGFLRLFFYAITHPMVIIRSVRQISKCDNLLGKQYFSMTPYKLGEKAAVKYSAIPHGKSSRPIPDKSNDDFLKDRLIEDLEKEDQYFDFVVQLQKDPELMPIEDPTVVWDSPFVKVATIRIPKQVFDTEEQRAYGEKLSFTPWHALESHRPLGGVNRARKLVYEQIATFRREKNDVENLKEPTYRITFNA